jgi:hypothetical protein
MEKVFISIIPMQVEAAVAAKALLFKLRFNFARII